MYPKASFGKIFSDKLWGIDPDTSPPRSMFEKFYLQFVRSGYILGMALLIGSLPHSKFMMSISQFVLAGAFILESIIKIGGKDQSDHME